MNDESSPPHAAIALVTGANRGLGKELVRALLAAGASKVYAAARDERQVERADRAGQRGEYAKRRRGEVR